MIILGLHGGQACGRAEGPPQPPHAERPWQGRPPTGELARLLPLPQEDGGDQPEAHDVGDEHRVPDRRRDDLLAGVDLRPVLRGPAPLREAARGLRRRGLRRRRLHAGVRRRPGAGETGRAGRPGGQAGPGLRIPARPGGRRGSDRAGGDPRTPLALRSAATRKPRPCRQPEGRPASPAQPLQPTMPYEIQAGGRTGVREGARGSRGTPLRRRRAPNSIRSGCGAQCSTKGSSGWDWPQAQKPNESLMKDATD